jgi:hypothetical protein
VRLVFTVCNYSRAQQVGGIYQLFRAQNSFHVHIEFGGLLFVWIVGRVVLFDSLHSRIAGLSHSAHVIFLCVGVQHALAAARLVGTVRRLTKVRVILDFHLANVAHKGTAGASHLVAAVTLHDGLFAFGTFADHRVRDGFFDSKTPLGLNFFFNFVATAKRAKRCVERNEISTT